MESDTAQGARLDTRRELRRKQDLYVRAFVADFFRELEFIVDVLRDRASRKETLLDRGVSKVLEMVCTYADLIELVPIGTMLQMGLEEAWESYRSAETELPLSPEDQVTCGNKLLLAQVYDAARVASRRYAYFINRCTDAGIMDFAYCGVDRVIYHIARGARKEGETARFTKEHILAGLIYGKSGRWIQGFHNTAIALEDEHELEAEKAYRPAAVCHHGNGEMGCRWEYSSTWNGQPGWRTNRAIIDNKRTGEFNEYGQPVYGFLLFGEDTEAKNQYVTDYRLSRFTTQVTQVLKAHIEEELIRPRVVVTREDFIAYMASIQTPSEADEDAATHQATSFSEFVKRSRRLGYTCDIEPVFHGTLRDESGPVDLSGGDFSGCDFSWADLRGCTAAGANFTDAYLVGTLIGNLPQSEDAATLTREESRAATPMEEDAAATPVQRQQKVNWIQVNLSWADLSHAEIKGCQISGDISHAHMTGTKLTQSEIGGLSGYDTASAEGLEIDPSNTDLDANNALEHLREIQEEQAQRAQALEDELRALKTSQADQRGDIDALRQLLLDESSDRTQAQQVLQEQVLACEHTLATLRADLGQESKLNADNALKIAQAIELLEEQQLGLRQLNEHFHTSEEDREGWTSLVETWMEDINAWQNYQTNQLQTQHDALRKLEREQTASSGLIRSHVSRLDRMDEWRQEFENWRGLIDGRVETLEENQALDRERTAELAQKLKRCREGLNSQNQYIVELEIDLQVLSETVQQVQRSQVEIHNRLEAAALCIWPELDKCATPHPYLEGLYEHRFKAMDPELVRQVELGDLDNHWLDLDTTTSTEGHPNSAYHTLLSSIDEGQNPFILLKATRGGGKSLLLARAFKEVWCRVLANDLSVIPIFLDLKETRLGDTELIDAHLKRMGYAPAHISVLKRTFKFVFFLDGLCERKPKSIADAPLNCSLHEDAGFASWTDNHGNPRYMCITAARTQWLELTLYGNYLRHLLPYDKHYPVLELEISPPTSAQIHQSLEQAQRRSTSGEQEEKQHDHAAGAREVRLTVDEFAEPHGKWRAFASSPFLLSFALAYIKAVAGRTSESAPSTAKVILDVIETIIQESLPDLQNKSRLQYYGPEEALRKATYLYHEMSSHLAFLQFRRREVQLDLPGDYFTKENRWGLAGELVATSAQTQAMGRVLPLSVRKKERSSEDATNHRILCQFDNQMFGDFYLARYLYDLLERASGSPGERTDHADWREAWNQGWLSRTPETLEFLREMMQDTDERMLTRMREMLLRSIIETRGTFELDEVAQREWSWDPDAVTAERGVAAANAATVLNAMGFNWSKWAAEDPEHNHLSRVALPGVSLRGGILVGVDCSNSDLRGMDAVSALCLNTDFSHSAMEGAQFGLPITIHLPDERVLTSCYDPHAKRFYGITSSQNLITINLFGQDPDHPSTESTTTLLHDYGDSSREGEIPLLAMSSNGSIAVVTQSGRCIDVFETDTLQAATGVVIEPDHRREYSSEQEHIVALAWSDNGRNLACFTSLFRVVVYPMISSAEPIQLELPSEAQGRASLLAEKLDGNSQSHLVWLGNHRILALDSQLSPVFYDISPENRLVAKMPPSGFLIQHIGTRTRHIQTRPLATHGHMTTAYGVGCAIHLANDQYIAMARKIILSSDNITGIVTRLAWSPDGAMLAAVYRYPDAIVVWRISDKHLTVVPTALTVHGLSWMDNTRLQLFSEQNIDIFDLSAMGWLKAETRATGGETYLPSKSDDSVLELTSNGRDINTLLIHRIGESTPLVLPDQTLAGYHRVYLYDRNTIALVNQHTRLTIYQREEGATSASWYETHHYTFDGSRKIHAAWSHNSTSLAVWDDDKVHHCSREQDTVREIAIPESRGPEHQVVSALWGIIQGQSCLTVVTNNMTVSYFGEELTTSAIHSEPPEIIPILAPLYAWSRTPDGEIEDTAQLAALSGENLLSLWDATQRDVRSGVEVTRRDDLELTFLEGEPDALYGHTDNLWVIHTKQAQVFVIRVRHDDMLLISRFEGLFTTCSPQGITTIQANKDQQHIVFSQSEDGNMVCDKASGCSRGGLFGAKILGSHLGQGHLRDSMLAARAVDVPTQNNRNSAEEEEGSATVVDTHRREPGWRITPLLIILAQVVLGGILPRYSTHYRSTFIK